MIIVSDTSPIANLIQIGKLSLLKEVFGEIVIPPAVKQEIEKLANFGVPLEEFKQSDWIITKEPNNKGQIKEFMEEIDEGESEAIVLALEMHAEYVLMDERIGTKKARALGLQTIGLIGVLLKAKENGYIPEIAPVLQELINTAHFWISTPVYQKALELAKEQ